MCFLVGLALELVSQTSVADAFGKALFLLLKALNGLRLAAQRRRRLGSEALRRKAFSWMKWPGACWRWLTRAGAWPLKRSAAWRGTSSAAAAAAASCGATWPWPGRGEATAFQGRGACWSRCLRMTCCQAAASWRRSWAWPPSAATKAWWPGSRRSRGKRCTTECWRQRAPQKPRLVLECLRRLFACPNSRGGACGHAAGAAQAGSAHLQCSEAWRDGVLLCFC